MTTIQPLKNDQAVAQMVSKQTAPTQISLVTSQPIQNNQSPSASINKADTFVKNVTGKGADKSEKTSKGTSNKDVLLSGAATAPANEAVNRLTAIKNGKETSELQVLAVRASKAIEEKMESAQEKMNEIVNSYPPFLRGSEKRQQYLMSISSIRQQIESMTIPPTGKFDKNQALDTTASKETASMWANLFQDVGIPALEANGPNEASDAQIRTASSEVGAMKSELASRRAALEQQLAPAEFSPLMAQYMSQTAGHVLAQTGLSLTSNLTGALKGL